MNEFIEKFIKYHKSNGQLEFLHSKGSMKKIKCKTIFG